MTSSTTASVSLRPYRLPARGETIQSTRNNWFVVGNYMKSGAFADVFACTDYWSNELVAKVLKPSGSYEQDWARADAEATKLFALRHPCITYVHDAFEYEGAFYIITERCEDDLSDFLKESDRPALYVPYVASDVLQALHYLHSNGVRHCDLHSGNVLRSVHKDAMIPDKQEAWSFKVGDLGIAKLAHELLGPGATFKNCIRPPECINADEFGPVDERVDIYQAALLFLEMITELSSDFSEAQILAGVPRQRAEAVSDPIGQVLAKALRRHAAVRTASALDFWDDLNTAGWGRRT